MLGVVAKRTFDFDRDVCSLSEEQVPLVEAPVFDESSQLVHDTDLILQRRAADILLVGTAHSLFPTRRFRVRLRVGSFIRELDIIGDRRLVRSSGGGVELTEPEMITAMPLTWSRAYGGVDRILYEELGDPMLEFLEATGERFGPEHSIYAYPRNPDGRGYLLEASDAALAATSLPNIEDPAHPITLRNVVRQDPRSWPLAPLPVGTGWLSYTAFPRSLWGGMACPIYWRETIAPERIPEVASGLLAPEDLAKRRPFAERFSPNVTQSSAPGMRASEVPPDAEIELTHMHARWSRVLFRLPGETPRMGCQVPGSERVELEPKIRSVVIDLDASRLCVCWVGETPLGVPLNAEQSKRIAHAVLWHGGIEGMRPSSSRMRAGQ